VEDNFVCLARCKVNALKAAQSQQRRAVRQRKLQIELSDFIANQFACVRNRDLGGQRFACINRVGVEFQATLFEARVAQAESE